MVKRKTKKKVVKKKGKVTKPIGLISVGKSFRLAFGSKKNPRKGTKVFRSRKAAVSFAKKKYKLGR